MTPPRATGAVLPEASSEGLRLKVSLRGRRGLSRPEHQVAYSHSAILTLSRSLGETSCSWEDGGSLWEQGRRLGYNGSIFCKLAKKMRECNGNFLKLGVELNTIS